MLESSAQETHQAAADGFDFPNRASAVEDAQAAAMRVVPIGIQIEHERYPPLVAALRLVDVARVGRPGFGYRA